MSRKKICIIATVPMSIDVFLRPHIERLSGEYDVYVISNYANCQLPIDSFATYLHVPLARQIAPWSDVISLFSLLSVFKRHRFDIVHSVTPKAGFLGMLAACLALTPIRIHWFTGQVWATRNGISRFLLKNADRLIVFLSTYILADSHSQRDFLVSEGVCHSGSIQVICDGSICGVDAERFKPDAHQRNLIRSRFGVPIDAPLILFLGRLNFEKGLREFASAMFLLKEHVDLHWMVVGPDEEDMVEYIQSITSSFHERVHIHGRTSTPENYMAAADIFCLPSYREGFGSSVIEAAAIGLPTVASRIYGLTDAVVDGVTGLLVPSGDEHALALSLRYLVENSEVRSTMGREARNRAISQFSRERVVDGVLNFYKNISK